MKMRLDFLFTDLFQHLRIYLVGLWTQDFYSWAWVRSDVSHLCCEIKSHTITTQIKNQKFSKFKERVAQRH